MGKGLAFLTLKHWHPQNKTNREKKWQNEQRDRDNKRKQREREAQKKQEEELHATRMMIARQKGPNSEEYVKALEREPVAWMYNAPPGLNAALAEQREKMKKQQMRKEWEVAMTGMARDERRQMEKQLEEGLSVHERNTRRHAYLKDAPMQGDWIRNCETVHKPFGKQVKNVKCFKCGEWGHRVGDRECKFSSFNFFDTKISRQTSTTTKQMAESASKAKRGQLKTEGGLKTESETTDNLPKKEDGTEMSEDKTDEKEDSEEDPNADKNQNNKDDPMQMMQATAPQFTHDTLVYKGHVLGNVDGMHGSYAADDPLQQIVGVSEDDDVDPSLDESKISSMTSEQKLLLLKKLKQENKILKKRKKKRKRRKSRRRSVSSSESSSEDSSSSSSSSSAPRLRRRKSKKRQRKRR